MRGALNLASRPVRNERLPALVFAVAAFVMLLVTVQHAFIVYRLLPARSKALKAEVEAFRTESAALDTERNGLVGVTFTAQQKAEWAVIKSLVDRRTFWWSKLLEVLEKVLPLDIRIVSISPRIKDGRHELELTIHARSVDDGLNFVAELEKREEFADVAARSVGARAMGLNTANGEAEMVLTMRYLVPPLSPTTPAAVPRPSPTAAAATTASVAPREEVEQ